MQLNAEQSELTRKKLSDTHRGLRRSMAARKLMSASQLKRREDEYKKLNPSKLTKFCFKCKRKRLRKFFSKNVHRRDLLNGWCKSCLKAIAKKYLKSKREGSRKLRAALRLKVLRYYSNSSTPYCACCRISILEFLSIDHIGGGGSAHKRKVRHVYAWLRRNNFPSGFRVLFHNCNQSLGAYGYCPHDRI